LEGTLLSNRAVIRVLLGGSQSKDFKLSARNCQYHK